MLNAVVRSSLMRWHRMLGLRHQCPPSWHRERLREELHERRTATTNIHKLSEAADVFFTISRARYDGFSVGSLPSFVASRHAPVYTYMLAKYTLRWGFYRTAALFCRVPQPGAVREVVNPAKDSKMDEVSARHGIDAVQFRRVGRRLRRVWPLLP